MADKHIMRIPESELILNADGRIYHLNLMPDELADTIILVGDPGRVEKVSSYFDNIEVKATHREFITHTGRYKGKRISVISTGIGTDNIDIVLNELDALLNIDFKSRTVNEQLKSCDIIRIGTSGALQSGIPIDSILVSEKAIGFDSLVHFYDGTSIDNDKFSNEFIQQTNWNSKKATPYLIDPDASLFEIFSGSDIIKGITLTNIGFYGPQGRVLRLALRDIALMDKITGFQFEGKKIANLEMETAGIYALAKLLGHRAISLNAIIANRDLGTFSKDTNAVIHKTIQHTLQVLTK